MTKKIFLSSTAEDLDDHRDRVAHEIQHFDLLPVRMETFGALPERSVDACLRRVAECDALVVVVAHRYGWVPPTRARSDGCPSRTPREPLRS